MARTRYDPQQIIVATGGGTPALLTLSPAAPFRVYATATGGSPYTDLTGSDGTTALPVNGSGYPYCDLSGLPPVFYGPDGVSGVLWLDAFTGSRTPWYPAGQLHTTLTTGALLTSTTAQSFTGPTNFTSATASQFTTTPTFGGKTAAHAGNIASLFADPATLITFHNLTGQPYFIFINPSTGVWPNSGARVMPDGTSLSAGGAGGVPSLTAPLIWYSITWAGALEATGRIDTDIWWERVS